MSASAGVTFSAANPTQQPVTPGNTPADRWVVTREGILPWLSARHAEAGNDGTPWLAMQVTEGSLVTQVARLLDPVLGVHVGDTVEFDANGVGTCPVFEATITDFVLPDAARPGGAVRLGHRTPTNPAWDQCVDQITGPISNLIATVRAAGYVLVRGLDVATTHIARPEVGQPFALTWTDEGALAAQCLLPPSQPWNPASVAACDPACRAACEQLVGVRLARRLFYLSEQPSQLTGPAIGFTLALETAAPEVRDMALQIDTADGRAPFRVTPTYGVAVGAGSAAAWDRSSYVQAAGVRFLVPWASSIAVDGTPTVSGGGVYTIH